MYQDISGEEEWNQKIWLQTELILSPKRFHKPTVFRISSAVKAYIYDSIIRYKKLFEKV